MRISNRTRMRMRCHAECKGEALLWPWARHAPIGTGTGPTPSHTTRAARADGKGEALLRPVVARLSAARLRVLVGGTAAGTRRKWDCTGLKWDRAQEGVHGGKKRRKWDCTREGCAVNGIRRKWSG
jgi:hypothetical protein